MTRYRAKIEEWWCNLPAIGMQSLAARRRLAVRVVPSSGRRANNTGQRWRNRQTGSDWNTHTQHITSHVETSSHLWLPLRHLEDYPSSLYSNRLYPRFLILHGHWDSSSHPEQFKLTEFRSDLKNSDKNNLSVPGSFGCFFSKNLKEPCNLSMLQN